MRSPAARRFARRRNRRQAAAFRTYQRSVSPDPTPDEQRERRDREQYRTA